MTLYAVLFDDVDAPAPVLTEITLSASATTSASESDTYMPAESVTIAELIVDAGSASETRTIVDPTYPGADGDVTWIATDPLTGTDPGGKARYWARYPDGSGGFWRRDDWNALTVAEGAANAINIDWATIDNLEDATVVFQEMTDQYIDGTAGNVLSMKGPEGNSEFSIEDWTATGDGSASELYWYRPTTNACIIRSGAWALGSTDLMNATWTEDSTDKWSTTTVGDVVRFRTKDPNALASGNDNAISSTGPWWIDHRDASASVAAMAAVRDWHFDSGTNKLTLFTTSNPSTYYDDMEYITDYSTTDKILHWTNIHKVYVEGGANRHNSNPGIEFRGRVTAEPMAGHENSTGTFTDNYGIHIECTTGFTKTGSDCQWYAGVSEMYGRGLNFEGASSSLRYDTGVWGGIQNTTVEVGLNTISGVDQLHYYPGGTLGDKWEATPLWGDFWSGQISKTGAATGTPENRFATRCSPSGRGQRALIENTKITGRAEGRGIIPFFGSGSIQLGNSAADPLIIDMRGGFFTQGDLSHTPNNRPVFVDNESSIVPQYFKLDSWQHHQNSTVFVRFVLHGIVDRDDTLINVDIRQDGSNDVLNVSPNPATVNLGMRNPITVFEATNDFNTGFIGGQCEWINGDTSAGQGNIIVAELQPFKASFNFIGGMTHKGNGTDVLYVAFREVTCGFTFQDLIFGDRGGGGDFADEAIAIFSGDQEYVRPFDNNIIDCELQGDRFIPVGRSDGTRTAPINTVIKRLTVTGTVRDCIFIEHYSAGKHNEGHPCTVTVDDITGFDSSMRIAVQSGLSTDDVWLKVDNVYYTPPYTVGGSNTTKSGVPPDLLSTNHAYRFFTTATSLNMYMPPYVQDGEHVLVGIGWDGDPGTVTVPTNWTHISAADANLADGSLYVKYYQRTFTTGADAWNWDGQNITESWSWTNSQSGVGYSVTHRGQNDAPIGDANSQTNSATTTPTAPTLTTEGEGSLLVDFVWIGLSADTTAFGGSLSPWMSICRRDDNGNFGEQGTAASFGVAQLYSGATGSKAGCQFTIDTSAETITSSIEIKRGPVLIQLSAQATGSAEESDQLNP